MGDTQQKFVNKNQENRGITITLKDLKTVQPSVTAEDKMILNRERSKPFYDGWLNDQV